MEKKSSSTPFALEQTEGAREANRQYQAALAKLTQSLDQRKNRFFDPVWLAASQGFATPGVTDFFGSLGHVASNVNKAQEGLIKEDQAILQQQLELAGRGVELERQKSKDAIVRRYLSKEEEPTRPAGALPTSSRAESGEPSGARPAQGALAQAQGAPAQDMGIPLFPGTPGISRQEFFALGIADGKNMSDLAKEWEAIQRGRLQARENSLFDTGTGRLYIAPSADTVQVQIFNRDGSTPKTYPVTKMQAITLARLAEQNDAEGYFAFAERIIRGPQLQSAQRAAPSAPVVAPAAAAVSALPSPPTPLRTSGSAGAQAVPGSTPSNPARLPPVASGQVPAPQGGAQAAQGAPAADNQANLRQIPPKGTKDIFAGQLSEEEKQRIASDPNLKDFYEIFSQNAASFLNRPTNSHFYKQNVHLITEQAKRLNDLGIKVPGTLEEIRQALGVRFPDPPDIVAPEDFAGGQKMFNEIRRDYGEDAARSFNENGYLYTKNLPRLTPAAPSTAAERVPTPQAAAAPTQAAPPVVPQAAPSAAARPATAVVPPAAPVAPAAAAAVQAAPAQRQGLRSQEEIAEEKRQKEIQQAADTRRAEDLAKAAAAKEAAVEANDRAARNTYQSASKILDYIKKSPSYFGIFARPGVVPAIGGFIEQGLRTPTGTIDLPGFRQSITQLMPNVRQQDLDNLMLAAAELAEIELNFSRTYFQGTGSVTENERKIVRAIPGTISSSPRVLKARMELLRDRAQYDIDVADAFRDWQQNNAGRSYLDFERNSQLYKDIKKDFDTKAAKIYNGLPAIPSRERARSTGTQPSGSRSADNAAASDRLRELMGR